MGRYNLLYLESDKVYGCARCGTHLTEEDDLISTAFMGSHGKAFLFYKIVNFIEGKLERKSMTTGVHEVKNIFLINNIMTKVLIYIFLKKYKIMK